MDQDLKSTHSVNRRAFLKSGIAASSFALSSTFIWPSFARARAQAAAVDGVPNDLVSNVFGPLSGALLPPGEWHTYPKAGDKGWSTVPQQVRDSIIARADVVNSSRWPAMLATHELEFKRNGNRSRFEAISFGRRNRLGDLVLAECILNSGKYLETDRQRRLVDLRRELLGRSRASRRTTSRHRPGG